MFKNKFSVELIIGIVSLVGICVISFTNVLVRYATNSSFAFTEEFSVFFMVVLAFAGAAVAAQSNEHIRITLLEDLVGHKGKQLLIILQALASLIVLALILWFSAKLTYEEFLWESLSPGLGYPTWIYIIWLPCLTALIGLRIFQNTRQRLKATNTEKETS